MRVYTFLLGIILCSPVLAQNNRALLKNAEDEFNRRHYKGAIDLFQRYLDRSEDANAMIWLGRSNARLGDHESASQWFERSEEEGLVLDDADRLLYAESLLCINQRSKARAVIESYDGGNQRRKTAILNSISNYEVFMSNDMRFRTEPLNINSSKSDFGLMKYGDGYLLTSNRSYEERAQEEEYNYFGLYYTEVNNSGLFGSPKPFEARFDSKGNDGPISFFPGEKKAIVSRNNYHRGIRGVTHRGKNEIELYEVEKGSDGKWGKLKRLPFDNDNFSSLHPAISAGGTFMIFASDRPGGEGESDLYRVEYDNGQWSEPVNLGDKVNTSGKELFPSIVGDTVLYFSSNGHAGMGGLDLFSVKLDGSQDVQNLGSPFNSSGDDFSFLYLDKTRQVIASNRGNEIGRDDLLMIKRVIEPDQSNEVEVAVQLPETPPSYNVWLIDNLKSGDWGYAVGTTEVLTLQTEEGQLRLSGPSGESDVFEASSQSLKDVIEQAISVKNYTSIDPVFFGFNRFEANETALSPLSDLVDVLTDQDDLEIVIIGYADNRGDDTYNLNLSRKRAAFVKQQLIDLGIESSRLTISAKGESSPFLTCGLNCTAKENARERRVEFAIR